MDKKSDFSTMYDAPDAGTLAFDGQSDIGGDIDAYLDIIRQLKKDYRGKAEIVNGLDEVEVKLNALRISRDSPEEVQKKLASLTRIPFGENQSLDLAAFRKKSGQGKFEVEDDYLAHVAKLIRNTTGNLNQLLLFDPGDGILQRFLKKLDELGNQKDFKTLRREMIALGKSPQLWHYNEKKKNFLAEWLRPFQEALGQPIDGMSSEELIEALKKVEGLRDTRLEEMTNLTQEKNRDPFRAFNRDMHPNMNGNNKEFWGGSEIRDEFIGLMTKIISRFAFNLDDRFLLFKTRDGGFCYLIGFSDEALNNSVELEDGRVALYPHLKVFLKGKEDHYAEITREAYHGDNSAYYRALKTSVVPFLTAIAVMVEFELSREIKRAFDMWA